MIFVYVGLIAAAVILVAYFVGKRARMNPEKFMEAVNARLAEAHPDLKVIETNGLEMKIEKDGEAHTVFWDNAYMVYVRNPGYCNEIIDDFLKALTGKPELPATWDEARPRLLPALKSRAYLDEIAKIADGAEYLEKLVALDYRDGLCILLAIDSELTVAFATKDQLADWQVSPEQALDVAIENLGKLTGPLWPDAVETASQTGYFVFNTLDGYDASRLLLPDFYERASRALGCTRIAVGTPNRDFIIAYPADSSNLKMVADKVRADFQSYDHAISPDMIYLPE